MSLKERLEEELRDVTFSKDDQDRIKKELIHAAQTSQKSTGILCSLKDLWHGSTEIPLPAVIAVVLVLGLGLWTTYSTLLAVDQRAVAVFLTAGSESVHVISQGVSVL